MSERRASKGRHSVTLVPNDGQSETSIQADLDRSMAFGESLANDDVQEWRSRYWWRGPIKVMVGKEVGPPPWKWPRMKWRGSWDAPLTISCTVGWRMTAYRVYVMWAGRFRGE